MTQLGFFIDLTKCTGCKTCTVACKDAHNLEVGRNFRKVHEVESGFWKQDPETGAWHQDVRAYYVSVACNHCADPACVKVCPTNAHYKRKEDGLVVINTKRCIGCRACEVACPYHAPVFNPATKRMSKCDGCLDRLKDGLQPICVESCPQRAIEFGPIEKLRKKYGELADIVPLPNASLTKPSLVIRPPKGM